MSFQYVDRIYACESKKYIRGLKNVTRNESFFYWLPDGRRVLSPAVISEALAQLGAWLKMFSTDFERRPVLLADELSEYPNAVEAGDQIDLSVEVLDFGDDVVTTRGLAQVNGRDVVVGHCCRGYLLPMEDFCKPEDARRAYANLYKPDLENGPRLRGEGQKLKAIAGPQTFESLRFVDGLLEHVPYERVVGFKNFTMSEPYFRDHFPHKPVVPGVLLLTFIGEVCQYLIKETIDAPVRARALIPTAVRNVRLRKFVTPGDQCILTVKVKDGSCRADGDNVVVDALVMANGLRVMQAEMSFRVMHAVAGRSLQVAR